MLDDFSKSCLLTSLVMSSYQGCKGQLFLLQGGAGQKKKNLGNYFSQGRGGAVVIIKRVVKEAGQTVKGFRSGNLEAGLFCVGRESES